MSVEKLIIPLVMNINPHSVLSLCYSNDLCHQPLLTKEKNDGETKESPHQYTLGLVLCSLSPSGWSFRCLKSTLCRRERTKSCTCGRVECFAFITELQGWNSSETHTEENRGFLSEESKERHRRAQFKQHPALDMGVGDGGWQPFPDRPRER